MSPAPTPRPTRLWRAVTWASGSILVLAVILALGSTVWRIQQSLDLLDQPGTTAESFRAMIETSLDRTKLGLLIGMLAAPVYLLSLIQLHRRRRVGDNTGG